MSNTLIEKFVIREDDVDIFNKWKLSSIFSAVQQVSSHHVDTIKCGGHDLNSIGLAWVIAREKIEIVRLPKANEVITIKAWPGNTMKFIFPRYTTLSDEQGNVIIKACTLWSVVDMKTRTVVTEPEKRFKYFEIDDKVAPLLSHPSSMTVDGLINTNYYETKFTDLDFNDHVNNSKYLDWITNLLDLEYLKTHTAKSIQINYLHEISYKDKVCLCYNLEDDKLAVSGKVKDKQCFVAKINF